MTSNQLRAQEIAVNQAKMEMEYQKHLEQLALERRKYNDLLAEDKRQYDITKEQRERENIAKYGLEDYAIRSDQYNTQNDWLMRKSARDVVKGFFDPLSQIGGVSIKV